MISRQKVFCLSKRKFKIKVSHTFALLNGHLEAGRKKLIPGNYTLREKKKLLGYFSE
jgi:hypothetical protein